MPENKKTATKKETPKKETPVKASPKKEAPKKAPAPKLKLRLLLSPKPHQKSEEILQKRPKVRTTQLKPS